MMGMFAFGGQVKSSDNPCSSRSCEGTVREGGYMRSMFIHRPSGKEIGRRFGEFAEDLKEKTTHLADLTKGKVRSAYWDTKSAIKKSVNRSKRLYEREKSKLLKTH
jgi:uncharacterized protein YjbJ (UPF0337 family)